MGIWQRNVDLFFYTVRVIRRQACPTNRSLQSLSMPCFHRSAPVPRSPTPSSPTFTPFFYQKLGHVLVKLSVRPTHPDAMITARGGEGGKRTGGK